MPARLLCSPADMALISRAGPRANRPKAFAWTTRRMSDMRTAKRVAVSNVCYPNDTAKSPLPLLPYPRIPAALDTICHTRRLRQVSTSLQLEIRLQSFLPLFPIS